ncbi:MAG: hypothetical protein AAF411_17355 [Myxococcota bacterium]
MHRHTPWRAIAYVLLGGCFGSSGVEPACESPCDPSSIAIDFCSADDFDCETATDCRGELVYCERSCCDEPPACPPGSEAVLSCDGHEGCIELADCGGLTLYCAPRLCTEPRCEGNLRISDMGCESDFSGRPPEVCLEDTTCDGTPFWCFSQGLVCNAVAPDCPDGFRSVSFCSRMRDPDCQVFGGCASDRFCLPDTYTVTPGTTCAGDEIESDSRCDTGEFERSECRQLSDVCGQAVYCRARVACDGPFPEPVCAADFTLAFDAPCSPSELESGSCYIVSSGPPGCGGEAYCRRVEG